jgi:CRISPR-associated protein Cas2
MWLFAMFDLPVDTKEARTRYTRFRTFLLGEGFTRLQFSIYARYCGSEERSEAFRRRLRKVLPPDGDVRLLSVTDHQFGKMEIYSGKKLQETERPPEQVMLF